MKNNMNDNDIFQLADSIKDKIKMDFNTENCINNNVKLKHFKKKRKMRKIGILVVAIISIFTISASALAVYPEWYTALYSKLFHSPNYDQGLDKAEETGYAKSVYVYSESSGIRLAVTACVSDQTRTVFQVELTGEYNREDPFDFSGISVYDESGNEYFVQSYGERFSTGKETEKELPQSTLIRCVGGPSKDGNVYLHISSISGIQGDWNIKIPVTIKPTYKYSTTIDYSEGNFSIDIYEITIAPTQTIIKCHIRNMDIDSPGFILENNTTTLNCTSASALKCTEGYYDYTIRFGSLDLDSDLTLSVKPDYNAEFCYKVEIPIDQLEIEK